MINYLFILLTGNLCFPWYVHAIKNTESCISSARFAGNSLRYCLIKQLNKEKRSILITAKVHTHVYQGYKIYLKHNAIDHYSVNCNIFECYVCQKLDP